MFNYLLHNRYTGLFSFLFAFSAIQTEQKQHLCSIIYAITASTLYSPLLSLSLSICVYYIVFAGMCVYLTKQSSLTIQVQVKSYPYTLMRVIDAFYAVAALRYRSLYLLVPANTCMYGCPYGVPCTPQTCSLYRYGACEYGMWVHHKQKYVHSTLMRLVV